MKARAEFSRQSLGPALIACALPLLVICASCSWRRPAAPPPEEALPPDVAGDVAPHKLFDRRPYEFIWATRREEQEPLIDFERALAWVVEDGATNKALFSRTDEIQLWGSRVGRLSWSADAAPRSILLRLADPIPIRDRFDCVSVWLDGRWQGMPDAGSLEVFVRMVDANAQPVSIALGAVQRSGWSLLHHKLTAAETSAIRLPCRFVGLEFNARNVEGAVTVYFDSLSVHSEYMRALDAGAPFAAPPDDDSTIIPRAIDARGRWEVVSAGQDYEFIYKDDLDELRYQFSPAGGLAGIRLRWNGEDLGALLDESRVVMDGAEAARLLVSQWDERGVRVAYANGLSLDLSPSNKSLVIEARCPGGNASSMSLGCLARSSGARSIQLPFMSAGTSDGPRVHIIETGRRRLFVTVLADWLQSNASSIRYGSDATNDGGAYHGELTYDPRTDGRRNSVSERIVISASSEISHILPAVGRHPAPRAPDLAGRIWADTDDPVYYDDEMERCGWLRAYGLDKIMTTCLRSCWQDGHSDSYSFRSRAAARRGGEAALAEFIRAQQATGWLAGLYFNVTTINPINEHWTQHAVQRDPAGNWRRAGNGCYGVKPAMAGALDTLVTAAIISKYNPDLAYVDELASSPPWANTDFDERIAGAGMFAASHRAYLHLLAAKSEQMGKPLVGSGGAEMFYAGAMDAQLCDPQKAGLQDGDPLLPIFALQELRPFCMGIGIGSMDEYFRTRANWEEDASAALDQYLALQLAYGQLGRLAPERLGMPLTCRSYYMLQQIQSRYAMQSPSRIAYWDGTNYVSTSLAIGTDTGARSQLYVNYPGGLELWVNGATNRNWEVRVGRDVWTLPPYGWFASGPGITEISALIDGRRIDYVATEAYIYFDGRGSASPFRHLASATPIVLRSSTNELGYRVEVTDIARAGSFGIRPWHETMGLPYRCVVYSDTGEEIGSSELVEDGGLFWVSGPPDGFRYVIDMAAIRRPAVMGK